MNYTILAPAFYRDWDKVRYLKKSAEKWNVPITFYGFNESYKGWHDVQIDRLIREVEKVDTEWVVYTDASDAIVNSCCFIKPWADVVVSIEQDKHMCAGGWVGKKTAILDILKYLKDFNSCRSCGPDTMNPQIKWRCMLHWRPEMVALDYYREIFQVADEPLDIHNNKIYNPRTQTHPFIVHWAGGYTDPEVGKAALIEPTWKQLGF